MRFTDFHKGGTYIISNLGNRETPIFLENSDYERFLFSIAKYCQKYNVEILAYSLFKNRYNLLLCQNSEISISKLMHSFGISYTQYFNIKNSLVGHLFKGKFVSREITNKKDLLTTLKSSITYPTQKMIINN